MTHTAATLIRLLFAFIAISTIAITILLSEKWLLAWAIGWTVVVNRLCVSIFKDVANINDDYYKDSYSSGINIGSLIFLLVLVATYVEILGVGMYSNASMIMFALLITFGSVSGKLKELEDHKTDMDRMVKHHIFKK
jgi:uncharacterized membrane protein